MIDPINQELRDEVTRETWRYVALASELLDYPFPEVPVHFDLRGRAAGMFKAHGKRSWLRYNPWIFAKYYDEHFSGTIPHEVAHYIVHELYGYGVKPHGREWQGVMALFGAEIIHGNRLRDRNHRRLWCGRSDLATTPARALETIS